MSTYNIGGTIPASAFQSNNLKEETFIGTHTVFDLHYRKTLWFTTTNGGLNPKIVVFPNLSTDEYRQYSARFLSTILFHGIFPQGWEVILLTEEFRKVYLMASLCALLHKNCFPTETAPLPQKQNDLSGEYH